MRLIVKSLPLPVEICLNILPLIVPSTLQRIFPSKCYVFNIKCIALRTPKMVTSCSFKWGYKPYQLKASQCKQVVGCWHDI